MPSDKRWQRCHPNCPSICGLAPQHTSRASSKCQARTLFHIARHPQILWRIGPSAPGCALLRRCGVRALLDGGSGSSCGTKTASGPAVERWPSTRSWQTAPSMCSAPGGCGQLTLWKLTEVARTATRAPELSAEVNTHSNLSRPSCRLSLQHANVYRRQSGGGGGGTG